MGGDGPLFTGYEYNFEISYVYIKKQIGLEVSGPYWQLVSIGSSNGSVPIRRGGKSSLSEWDHLATLS